MVEVFPESPHMCSDDQFMPEKPKIIKSKAGKTIKDYV